jgi:hypothetical protein
MHHMNGSCQTKEANIICTMHLHIGTNAYQLNNPVVTGTQVQCLIHTVMVMADCFISAGFTHIQHPSAQTSALGCCQCCS